MTVAESLAGHARFLHWGAIQISLPNFLVIVIMVAIFVLALVLPFPHGADDPVPPSEQDRKAGRHE